VGTAACIQLDKSIFAAEDHEQAPRTWILQCWQLQEAQLEGCDADRRRAVDRILQDAFDVDMAGWCYSASRFAKHNQFPSCLVVNMPQLCYSLWLSYSVCSYSVCTQGVCTCGVSTLVSIHL
jgi:hypothetical protein